MGRGKRGKRFRRTVAGTAHRAVLSPRRRHGRQRRHRHHRGRCRLHHQMGTRALARPPQQISPDTLRLPPRRRGGDRQTRPPTRNGRPCRSRLPPRRRGGDRQTRPPTRNGRPCRSRLPPRRRGGDRQTRPGADGQAPQHCTGEHDRQPTADGAAATKLQLPVKGPPSKADSTRTRRRGSTATRQAQPPKQTAHRGCRQRQHGARPTTPRPDAEARTRTAPRPGHPNRSRCPTSGRRKPSATNKMNGT